MVDLQRIKEIVFGKTPQWVIKAREEAKVLNTHVNGVGSAEYLNKLEQFENDEQFNTRKKLLTSNRFLFANLSRPIDKTFNASGGSRVLPQKNNEKIQKVCDNIRHGYSIKQWIRNVQANKYIVDPCGIVQMEWNDLKTWPVIKSIEKIKNYESDGRLIQWICFEPKTENDKRTVQFIDDSFDYTFEIVGEDLILIEDKSFKNPFGRCPAIINSELMHFELDRHESPFAPVIDLADHFLRTGSVKNVYENKHGFPIFWMYGIPCKKCHGSGVVDNGDDDPITCPSCGGKGNTTKRDVQDIVQLAPPVDANDPVIAPNVAGYIQPELETWREYRTELQSLTETMHYTLWGTSYKRDQETATATFIDAQPVNERLFIFSEAFEDMDQKITELVALYFNGSADGVSTNWGKRFQLESSDALWNRYINAKKEGANKTTLDYLLTAFYQAEYANDSEMLNVSMKLIRIEPFVHLTEKEAKDLGLTGFDWLAKIYFNEWVSSLEEGYLSVTDIKRLRTDFETFVKAKEEMNKPAEPVEPMTPEPEEQQIEDDIEDEEPIDENVKQ